MSSYNPVGLRASGPGKGLSDAGRGPNLAGYGAERCETCPRRPLSSSLQWSSPHQPRPPLWKQSGRCRSCPWADPHSEPGGTPWPSRAMPPRARRRTAPQAPGPAPKPDWPAAVGPRLAERRPARPAALGRRLTGAPPAVARTLSAPAPPRVGALAASAVRRRGWRGGWNAHRWLHRVQDQRLGRQLRGGLRVAQQPRPVSGLPASRRLVGQKRIEQPQRACGHGLDQQAAELATGAGLTARRHQPQVVGPRDADPGATGGRAADGENLGSPAVRALPQGQLARWGRRGGPHQL